VRPRRVAAAAGLQVRPRAGVTVARRRRPPVLDAASALAAELAVDPEQARGRLREELLLGQAERRSGSRPTAALEALTAPIGSARAKGSGPGERGENAACSPIQKWRDLLIAADVRHPTMGG
jgi:hypothetical protein